MQKIFDKIKRNKGLIFLIVILVVLGLSIISLFTGTVAVVSIKGSISDEEASEIVETLNNLEEDIFVKAVVLKINTPGGDAEAIEEIYFNVLSLKKRKPVIASIDSIGASGGYYISLAADQVYAKPSSYVGSIAVLISLPEKVEEPRVFASGPFKVERRTEKVLETMDLIKKSFLQVVIDQRGDKLKIDPVKLTGGQIYSGLESREIGLIDWIGSQHDAVKKAADLAGLKFYNVRYVEPVKFITLALRVEKSEVSANSTTSPKFYYLYVNMEK